MKRLLFALAVVVALVWYLHRSDETTPPPPVAASPASGHVRVLANASERQAVAGRIASAQAAHSRTPEPTLTPIAPTFTSSDPVAMKQTVRAAMHEVVMHLLTCYESSFASRGHKGLDIVAHLTLTGDPDIGTLIDAPQLFDADKEPLPTELDACLRDNLQQLELPPLAEGDHVVLDYPFTFRPAVPDTSGSDDDGDDDDNEL